MNNCSRRGRNRDQGRLVNALIILLLTTVVVSACGFNARGSGRQSGSQVVGQLYIEGDASILRALRNELTAQQVQFATKRADADTLVLLDKEELSRRVASVSSVGRVSEYELQHAIDLLTIRSTDGIKAGQLAQESIDKQPQTVSVIRDYTYDETDVLAKDDEERILRAEMSDELVRHLVLRIFAGSL